MFGWSNKTRVPSNLKASTSLLGMTSLVANSVYDAEGALVGKLEEIVIDIHTGCVRHVVLAVGGILGIGRRRLAIPWSALTPDTNYRRCVVNVTQMQLTAVRVPDDDPWLQHGNPAQVRGSFSQQRHAPAAR